MLYLKQRRVQEARAQFLKAVAGDPTNGMAYLALGDAHLACGDDDNAFACWVNATRFDPSGVSGIAARARLSEAKTRLLR